MIMKGLKLVFLTMYIFYYQLKLNYQLRQTSRNPVCKCLENKLLKVIAYGKFTVLVRFFIAILLTFLIGTLMRIYPTNLT